jgi:hypothetical protein
MYACQEADNVCAILGLWEFNGGDTNLYARERYILGSTVIA